jgi:P4 family phage/plasmid primase-like protien
MDANKNSKPKPRVPEDPIDISRGTSREFDWPRPLKYNAQSGMRKCAARFLKYRLEQIISSERQLYSLRSSTNMWTPVSDDQIAGEIAATDYYKDLSPDQIHKMVESMHLDCITAARPGMWIDPPPNAPDPEDIIIFRNGLLNLKTMELIPHSAAFFVTAAPDYDYDPAATCPNFETFLGQVLAESFHPTLQEAMGLTFTTETKYHVMVQLIGATRGGKGTILRVLEKMVGKDNAGSTSMDSLSSEFGLEGLENARLIIIPDAKDARGGRNRATERMLMVSGGDAVPINRKNASHLRRPIPAKIWMAANKHLSFLDDASALAARSLVFQFNNSFLGKEDRNLDARLASELPGIANWAIRGLKRLQRQGRFTVGAAGRAAAEELAMSNSPIQRFIRDHIRVTEGASAADCIPTDELFEGYRVWATYLEQMQSKDIRGRNQCLGDFMSALRGKRVAQDRRKHKNADSGQWEHLSGVYGVRWSKRPMPPDG